MSIRVRARGQRVRIKPGPQQEQDNWDRFGRPHFLTRRAFESIRRRQLPVVRNRWQHLLSWLTGRE